MIRGSTTKAFATYVALPFLPDLGVCGVEEGAGGGVVDVVEEDEAVPPVVEGEHEQAEGGGEVRACRRCRRQWLRGGDGGGGGVPGKGGVEERVMKGGGVQRGNVAVLTDAGLPVVRHQRLQGRKRNGK